MSFIAKQIQNGNSGQPYEYKGGINANCGPFFLQYQKEGEGLGQCTYYALNAFYGSENIKSEDTVNQIVTFFNSNVKQKFRVWVNTNILTNNTFNLSKESLNLYTLINAFEYNILY